MSPIYNYACETTKKEWESFKHKFDDRYHEKCKCCNVPAKLLISLPRVHAFESWYYRNLKEREMVHFGSVKERDTYARNRGMRLMDQGEKKKIKEEVEEIEHRPRAKYSVDHKIVNGRPTRVVTPQ